MRCEASSEKREDVRPSGLRYGLSPSGSLVDIADVAAGLGCSCTCPACGAQLIAKKGAIKVHHFAHHHAAECAQAHETVVHLLAKKALSESNEVCLPNVVFEGQLIEQRPTMRINECTTEVSMGDIVPDAIVTSDKGSRLAIEVAVTHFCDEFKIAKYKREGLSAIEIDLSLVPRMASYESIRDAVLRKASRSWLHNNKQAALDAWCAKKLAEKKKQALLDGIKPYIEAFERARLGKWRAMDFERSEEWMQACQHYACDECFKNFIVPRFEGDFLFTCYPTTLQRVILFDVADPRDPGAVINMRIMHERVRKSGLIRKCCELMYGSEWGEYKAILKEMGIPTRKVAEIIYEIAERAIQADPEYYIRGLNCWFKSDEEYKSKFEALRDECTAMGRSEVAFNAWMETDSDMLKRYAKMSRWEICTPSRYIAMYPSDPSSRMVDLPALFETDYRAYMAKRRK